MVCFVHITMYADDVTELTYSISCGSYLPFGSDQHKINWIEYGHIDQLLNPGYVWTCLLTYVCVCVYVCECVCVCVCVSYKFGYKCLWLKDICNWAHLYLNHCKYEMSCSSHSPVHVSKESLDCRKEIFVLIFVLQDVWCKNFPLLDE